MLELQKIFLLVKFFNWISCNGSLKAKISCFFCFFCLILLMLECSRSRRTTSFLMSHRLKKYKDRDPWSFTNGKRGKCWKLPILEGNCKFFQLYDRRRNFSLVARYSLKFTCCLLLVVKSLVTLCKIRLLLVAEVACCKKSLVTHCRSCSLQNITRYSLQTLLITHCRSCSLQKITCCSFQKITGFSLSNSLDTHSEKSFFIKTITCWNYCLFKVNKVRWKF